MAHLKQNLASPVTVQSMDGRVSFLSRAAKVYDTKPKLKIRGKEFWQLSKEDLEFDPPVLVNGEKQFEVSIQSEDTILLELAPGKR